MCTVDFQSKEFPLLIHYRVKLARAGVGGNFCVLKHFYDTSPMWRRIREEGNKQNDAPAIKSDEQIAKTKGSLNFGPIGAFHLADLNVLRSRVIKLLLNSPNRTHVAKDLILTLVSLPTSTFVHHTHRTKGIREPYQNGTSFFQYATKRIDQPRGDRESHPHKHFYRENFYAVHSFGRRRRRRRGRGRGGRGFCTGWH